MTNNNMKFTTNSLIAAVLSVVFIATVIGAFAITGSPQKERIRKLDQQRINDLQQITYGVDTFVNQKHQLPSDLKTLASTKDVYVASLIDPMSKLPYEFSAVSSTSYNLCATFESEATSMPEAQPGVSNFWSHPIGHHCFLVDVIDRSTEVPIKTTF